MVWACFSGANVDPMIVCNTESVTVDRYIEILNNGAVTFIDELLTAPEDSDMIKVATPDSYLFMHDNAPCHTAIKVTQYLKKRHLQIMKWPAQLPDLNPIENLSMDFKETFYKRLIQERIKPSTRSEIMKRCEELLIAV